MFRRIGLAAAALSLLSACARPLPVANETLPPGKPQPAMAMNAAADARQRLMADSQQRVQWARDAIADGTRRPLTIADAQREAARRLRDPESARFTEVRRDAASGAVCGLVNAKNLYGAYTGATPFVYFHASDAPNPQVLVGNQIAAIALIYAEAFCPSVATRGDQAPARRPATERPAPATDRT